MLMAFQCPLDNFPSPTFSAEVSLDDKWSATRTNRSSHCFCGLAIHVAQDKPCPLLSKAPGRGSADVVDNAHDDCNPALKIHAPQPPRSIMEPLDALTMAFVH
jgi:hypothetical protein